MKSVALICCDHGLGHLRRELLIAGALIQKGISVTIFAPLAKINHLKLNKRFSLDDCIFIDLSTKTRPELFNSRHDEIISWLNYLPDIQSYDCVISDNLPEILTLRSDAILISHFFWHKVLPFVNQTYFNFCEELLDNKEPLIIGSGDFTMEYISSRSKYSSVGIFVDTNIDQNRDIINRQNNILITGGSTLILKDELLKIIPLLDKLSCINKIYLDPSLYFYFNKNDYILADFSPEMFCSISFCLCRPGLGIISDLLFHRVRPIIIYEKENLEMIFNANQLRMKNLGYIYNVGEDIENLLKKIISQSQNFPDLNYNGIEAASKIINNRCLKK